MPHPLEDPGAFLNDLVETRWGYVPVEIRGVPGHYRGQGRGRPYGAGYGRGGLHFEFRF